MITVYSEESNELILLSKHEHETLVEQKLAFFNPSRSSFFNKHVKWVCPACTAQSQLKPIKVSFYVGIICLTCNELTAVISDQSNQF